MLSRGIPAWVLVGGATLTCSAGCINAVGFLGIHHQALSHMSGTATAFSTDLAAERGELAVHAAFVLMSFFLGSTLSGVIIRQSVLQMGRRYGVALTCESILLFAAAHFLRSGSNNGDYLAAAACGLQNALATTYSGAIVRTTHITGLVTDLGIAAGLALRREVVDHRRVILHLTLVAGFIGGGILGALGFRVLGVDTLFFPASVIGVVGIGYSVSRQFSRKRASASHAS
jgi:uncharacterized membrane protein YoaK (UPF0700 family)